MRAAMNSVTQHFDVQFGWRLPIHRVGLFAMSMADADCLWRYVLFHPGRSVLPFSYATLTLIGLPGGVLLFWLLTRLSKREPVVLSTLLLVITFAAFVGTMTIFWARALEARYMSAIGIALIPAAVEAGAAMWPKGNRITRAGARRFVLCHDSNGLWCAVANACLHKLAQWFHNPLLADTDASSPLQTL